jgi:hypothetical protein
MFSSTPFYHECIRKTVIAFGSLFNDIYVDMGNDEILRVPLAYAPKQKWYNRISDGELEDGRAFSLTLPRMGFDIINYSYDTSRKRNTIMKTMKIHDADAGITGYDSSKKESLYRYAEVPYTLEFGLYVMSKNMDTGLKIIEQILPYFTPEFTVTINYTEIDKKIDIPIILNSIDSEDLYEDGLEERRTIIWTLNFEVKSYFYGPVRDSKVILEVGTAIHDNTTTEEKDLSRLIAGVTGDNADDPNNYETVVEQELFKDIDSTWFD